MRGLVFLLSAAAAVLSTTHAVRSPTSNLVRDRQTNWIVVTTTNYPSETLKLMPSWAHCTLLILFDCT